MEKFESNFIPTVYSFQNIYKKFCIEISIFHIIYKNNLLQWGKQLKVKITKIKLKISYLNN